jgi:hypothetical protein
LALLLHFPLCSERDPGFALLPNGKENTMPAVNGNTIVMLFDDRGKAEGAMDELLHAGFQHDRVGIAMPGGTVRQVTTPIEEAESDAAEGAVAGAVGGSVAGAVAGALVSGLIPGIGPVMGGGILTGILLGAAAGAAGGSYVGPFIAMGLTEADARQVGHELKAGRTVVVVKPGDRHDEAVEILRSHGGHEIAVGACK